MVTDERKMELLDQVYEMISNSLYDILVNPSIGALEDVVQATTEEMKWAAEYINTELDVFAEIGGQRYPYADAS